MLFAVLGVSLILSTGAWRYAADASAAASVPGLAARQAGEEGSEQPLTPRPGFYVLGSPELDPGLYHVEGNLGVWHWAHLETSGGYNWGSVDSFLNRHHTAGRATGIMITTYEARCCGGVEAMPAHLRTGSTVVTLPGGWKVPRYWGDAYLAAYRALIEAFGERYRDDPRLHYVAIGTGAFGETRPTDRGDRSAIEAAGLTSELWVETVNAITQIYVDAFSDEDGNLLKPLLLQAAPRHLYDSERRLFADYAVERGVGISINGLYATMNGTTRPAINHCRPGGTIRHCGMYDIIMRGADDIPGYEHVPVAFETYGYMLPDRKHFRWGLFNGLNKRVDYIRVRFDLLYDNRDPEQIIPDNNALMAWGKQYMGVTAATTPAVWVALREHTDPWYSPVLGGSGETPAHTYQAGNYEFWLRQVEVDGGRTKAETNDSRLIMPAYNPSLPPPGPSDDQNPEAWVIRRTQQEIGEHRMYFAVDNAFTHGNSISPSGGETHDAVVITVVYWDNRSNDRWQLWYDSSSGPEAAYPQLETGRTSATPWVEKRGTGKFRRAVFHINDARFEGAFPGGTDFYIDSRNANGEADGNEWIHYVEVRRQGLSVTPLPITDEEPVLPPCYDFTETGAVSAPDIQRVASRWGARVGQAGYELTYDVNGDGVINMLDVQIVAARWGQEC